MDLKKFNKFYQFINGGDNVVRVEKTINSVKAELFTPMTREIPSVKIAVRQFS
jgi:hypothetical protein